MHSPLQLKLIRFYFAILSPLFPKLAIRSAHRLFHYPINSNRRYKNEKTLQSPVKFTIPLNDVNSLQAYRWGNVNKPIVLLVHGWSTTVRSMSHFLDALIKEGYQVIAYDALRHGKSKGELSDLANWADSVYTVMKHIGPVECIIAHSFGGAAVTVASKRGLETKKLIFIAPIHNAISIAHHFSKKLGIPEYIINGMMDYTWQHNAGNFEKYGKDWQDIFESNFHVPTLVFHDEQDREVGIEHSRELCEKWTWTTLKPTKGLGHRKILDDQNIIRESLYFIYHEQH